MIPEVFEELSFDAEPAPGELDFGLLETNGPQNYRHWERMARYHPCAGAPWTQPEDGAFHLGRDFYARSAGIFERSSHYDDLARPKGSPNRP